MPSFAIFRTEKLKSAPEIRGAAGHNSRTRDTPNADHAGEVITLVDPGPDAHATVMARIDQAGAKARAGAVLAQEILLSASPEFFRPDAPGRAGFWEPDRLAKWRTHAEAWMRDRFGDRIISAHLHLDEATPHIQAIVVPLTDDGRLSARETFNPRTLQQMQTTYAKALAPLGIQRGLEGSQATHTSIQTFYGIAVKPVAPLPSVHTPPHAFREAERQAWAEDESKSLHTAMNKTVKKAQGAELDRRKAKEYQATADALRRNSAQLRALPLPPVLEAGGLKQDPNDAHQWKGAGMRISLAKGDEIGKWFDHENGKGGYGAIDLAMHLTSSNYKNAVAWLGGAVGAEAVQADALRLAQIKIVDAIATGKPAAPPDPDPDRLDQVRKYLTQDRGLDPTLVEWAIKAKRLYADSRGNAIFRYGIKDRLGEGVELRGTITDKPFHGYRGSKSYFILPPRQDVKELAVVESAIDALSYRQLHPGRGVVATGGGTSHAVLVEVAEHAKREGLRLIAAFDRDSAGYGHTAALRRAAMQVHPEVSDQEALAEREEPKLGKDWNDQLLSQLKATAPSPSPASSFPQKQQEPEPSLVPLPALDFGPGTGG